MTTLMDIKRHYLDQLHDALPAIVSEVKSGRGSHQNQAKSVNKSISELRESLVDQMPSDVSSDEKQNRLIILQYCVSVASLEYRHAVWPYEYMALSRRVGELWERFCSSAWDITSQPNVKRMEPPSFDDVLSRITDDILSASKDAERDSVAKTIDDIKDFIGEINMVEDEVFTVGNVPHVIDFKSGFGSNEKGNMLRLRAVGKAYRLWNRDTKLLFLVRQEQNNNYLEVIKREGLWDVHCGSDAYSQIDAITGSDMNEIRREVIDFESDLSAQFWSDLNSHLSDLSGYLRW